MGKKNKAVRRNLSPQPGPAKILTQKPASLWPWLVLVTGITALFLSPMLGNGFTNWDDNYYVTENPLLKGPDWSGIFTEPVVSNYHPLTMITLAINYQLGGLDPFSYHLFNYILHLLNTVLVFYFIYLISSKNTMIAAFTALVFGIHPLHVESVSWISERKDVLYTFFFLPGLIQYWKFLTTGKRSNYWFALLFCTLSLLSKPAAVVFPLVLLLLDYWKGREFNKKLLLEKIPFFLLAILFGIITIQIQSEKAIAGLDLYPVWSRFFFACYVIMIYFFRFFIPFPLSAFHPYPPVDDLGMAVYLSPLFIISLAAFLWYYRKYKFVVFGILFFVINLLLVLQIISIGLTIVSERYTYVPYIGLAFTAGMFIERLKTRTGRMAWAVPAIVLLVYGIMSFQRTKVWKDSESLWADAIKVYPDAPHPRTNRANYILKQTGNPENAASIESIYQMALEDCNVALKTNPKHIPAYESREFIYFKQQRYQEAIADATMLISLDPGNKLGYAIRGASYVNMNDSQKALEDLNKSLSIDPSNEFALEFRAILLFNHFKNYTEALADFDKVIAIRPLGNYFLNRSYCYYQLGNTDKARLDAQMALQNGTAVPEEYRKALNL